MSESESEFEQQLMSERQSSNDTTNTAGITFASTAGTPGRRAVGAMSDTFSQLQLVLAFQFTWMAVVLIVLLAIAMWTLERYFVLSLIGLLAARLLFAPTNSTPRWWRVLTWIAYAALGVLAYIVYDRLSVMPA